jgi:phosphatidylserine/phosphatidylglycerophosphate/cardiolipin synthase-like enzyme
MTDRIIRTSGTTGVTAEPVLTTVLVSELLTPSRELWLVSPWISDVEALDNTRGDFDVLFLDPVARSYSLAQVLAQLTHTGSDLTIVCRPDGHNRTFLDRLGRLADPDHLRLVDHPDVHEKTMCGHQWLLTGSMNFTARGMLVNDEAVMFRTDAQAAAQARMDFNHRWKGHQ